MIFSRHTFMMSRVRKRHTKFVCISRSNKIIDSCTDFRSSFFNKFWSNFFGQKSKFENKTHIYSCLFPRFFSSFAICHCCERSAGCLIEYSRKMKMSVKVHAFVVIKSMLITIIICSLWIKVCLKHFQNGVRSADVELCVCRSGDTFTSIESNGPRIDIHSLNGSLARDVLQDISLNWKFFLQNKDYQISSVREIKLTPNEKLDHVLMENESLMSI